MCVRVCVQRRILYHQRRSAPASLLFFRAGSFFPFPLMFHSTPQLFVTRTVSKVQPTITDYLTFQSNTCMHRPAVFSACSPLFALSAVRLGGGPRVSLRLRPRDRLPEPRRYRLHYVRREDALSRLVVGFHKNSHSGVKGSAGVDLAIGTNRGWVPLGKSSNTRGFSPV